MRTLEELMEDHEDEKRILVSQWSQHRDECIREAWLKAGFLGLIVGFFLGLLL